MKLLSFCLSRRCWFRRALRLSHLGVANHPATAPACPLKAIAWRTAPRSTRATPASSAPGTPTLAASCPAPCHGRATRGLRVRVRRRCPRARTEEARRANVGRASRSRKGHGQAPREPQRARTSSDQRHPNVRFPFRCGFQIQLSRASPCPRPLAPEVPPWLGTPPPACESYSPAMRACLLRRPSAADPVARPPTCRHLKVSWSRNKNLRVA